MHPPAPSAARCPPGLSRRFAACALALLLLCVSSAHAMTPTVDDGRSDWYVALPVAAAPIREPAKRTVEGERGVARAAQAASLFANDARDIASQHRSPRSADRHRRVVRVAADCLACVALAAQPREECINDA